MSLTFSCGDKISLRLFKVEIVNVDIYSEILLVVREWTVLDRLLCDANQFVLGQLIAQVIVEDNSI